MHAKQISEHLKEKKYPPNLPIRLSKWFVIIPDRADRQADIIIIAPDNNYLVRTGTKKSNETSAEENDPQILTLSAGSLFARPNSLARN